MISVRLKGGLGNQLFQLSAAKSISKDTNKEFYINSLTTPTITHSSTNYYQSIFKKFTPFFKNKGSSYEYFDCMANYTVFFERVKNSTEPVLLGGDFQDYRISDVVYDEFKELLWFDEERLNKKYPNISSTIFLHIRGGDYLTTDLLLDLRDYYKKAISLFPGKKFSVFTNDIHFSRNYLDDFDYEIVRENDEDSLYLMSQCEGGICANSTFSWWGGYLNKNRKITWPRKFSQKTHWHDNTYHVPGWIII
jgi:hypothetical protein